ncbi:MAG TPA: glycosyltransferase family 4 protein [Allosphingosinicella sp.]
MSPTILISINASWNIVNFRRGLIAGLQQQGFRVVALAPPDDHSARLRELGVDYHPIEIDKQGVSPRRDMGLLLRYRHALREIRPDVFLGYTAKPNIYGSIAAHMLGIPVINNVSGLGTAFIKQGLLTRIVSGLYRLAFARSRTVFFQNPEDRDMFVERRLVRAEQARLLPGSGVNLDEFRPADTRGSAGEPITFLLIARLLWDKGVGEFVEAARLVREAEPDARFQLLGFLDVENRTAVPRARVEAWVAEGLIEYLGPADDVRPLIGQADCVVLPSYREGLPRVLLEGAAMAKPLITTDVPGCRQVVDHGVNGLLCTVRDPRSLADAMLKMIRSGEARRSAMGAAGRRKIEAEYDERIAVGRYLDAIGEALNGSG